MKVITCVNPLLRSYYTCATLLSGEAVVLACLSFR